MSLTVKLKMSFPITSPAQRRTEARLHRVGVKLDPEMAWDVIISFMQITKLMDANHDSVV